MGNSPAPGRPAEGGSGGDCAARRHQHYAIPGYLPSVYPRPEEAL